jgi:DNA-binding SARP family transcriptional activator
LAYERHAGAWSRRNKVPRSWGAGLEFSVLGPVEVTVSGRSLAVGGARARAVLAMLLAQANHVVSADRLAGELWPGHPADRAMASLQVRLSELRKAFRSAGAAECLATRPPGYLLTVPPAALDSLRFARLAAEGSAALAAGDPAAAARQLTGALALWRGTAFAGIDVPSVRAEAARLEEMRLAVLESRAEALLEGGRHGEVIAELETLTAANPLAERLWSLRMLACTGPAARPMRCAPMVTCARSWPVNWASTRALRCVTCIRASCARIPHWTGRASARRAAPWPPCRRPAMRGPPTASTSPTRYLGTVTGTSSSCRG